MGLHAGKQSAYSSMSSNCKKNLSASNSGGNETTLKYLATFSLLSSFT